jgi:hypothetical protein
VQGKRVRGEDGALNQQTLQASMAGVDGCAVILSDTTHTEGEEAELPPEPEQFVLLDKIPQASSQLLLHACVHLISPEGG